ncbi:MAG TPA: Crp/Fnr family transcriptional regulator [Gemmatimonadaceae bacterium]|nr:Crp/Fnr family transcriptional regulator [Gemmatimonadaceae bacterium]
MGPTGTLPAQQKNGSILLSALSADDFARMEDHLEPVTLRLKDVLGDGTRPLDHVYFPESGMISLLAEFGDNKAVEMASVGREGMAGMALFYDAGYLPEKIVVQLPGRALRMAAAAFRESLDECASLRHALHRYAGCLYAFAAHNTACGLKHRTTARLARWLLHACDQSGTVNLQLTHVYAATMLGVRRSSVTVSAGELRARRLVDYTRSTIQVVDRPGLEEVACECYATIRSTYDRLIVR